MDAAASWFLGAACPICGAPTASVCGRCLATLGAPEPVRVPGTFPVLAAAEYQECWQSAIVAYKERRSRLLLRPLAGALALSVAEVSAIAEVASPLVLVPMPSRPAAVRERGLDVVAVLARRAADVLCRAGLPTQVDACLKHRRAVVDQAGLDSAARARNLERAMVARPRRTGSFVVVDDLTTTGSSLAEARRALGEAGVAACGGGVVCWAPRRDGRRG